MHFLDSIFLIWIQITLKFVYRIGYRIDGICLEGGLAPNRLYAITWTDHDHALQRYIMLLGLNQLNISLKYICAKSCDAAQTATMRSYYGV